VNDGGGHRDAGNGTPGAGPVLITGGAGFVGCNLAAKLLAGDERIVILDDLSRPGVGGNLRWLQSLYGDRLRHVAADIRDAAAVRSAIGGVSFVYHLAGQVAVTTSLQNPLDDHAVNVLGTLNVLEAIRQSRQRPGLLFASTNKVYGALPDVVLEHGERRCDPADEEIRRYGIGERQPLDFISPYGCSKGAADQYVLDYCRSYGVSATVLRMSCIYGPHQQATSDQGWVAHFLRTALAREALTIYGDGRQVRDVLYIDDFVAALLAARRRLAELAGCAYNIGGGTGNTLSLREMIAMTERLSRHPLELHHAEPRPGDQRWFAADHRRFTAATGWQPSTDPEDGIGRLWSWLQPSRRPAAEPALEEKSGSVL
jgi:CDP-paratose 2-epimerase